MVIDCKDDDGRVSVGAKSYLNDLRAKKIYTIARIVTFKDNKGVELNPNLAIKTTGGKVWRDHNGMAYLNPYEPRSWSYIIGIAKRAELEGFDEIQFDYVRFPTDGKRSLIAWSGANTPKGRSAAIAGFLAKARRELGALGVYVAADVFGITAYDLNDSGIGQHVETITPYLDYVCPMVYPSGFSRYTGNVADPVAQPGVIVFDSVRRYRLRSDKDAVIRPWLQSFKDYAYDKRLYGAAEIQAQIRGSEKAAGYGFMLWNASSRYSSAGLRAVQSLK